MRPHQSYLSAVINYIKVHDIWPDSVVVQLYIPYYKMMGLKSSCHKGVTKGLLQVIIENLDTRYSLKNNEFSYNAEISTIIVKIRIKL